MKALKKITALILVLAMSVSLSGCYNQDLTWAAKDGDDTVAIGVYLYYLYCAIDDAGDYVDSDTDVLDATIEGEDAETWIRAKAMNYLQSYIWVNKKVEEYNLDLTEDEKSSASQTTSYLINNYLTSFDDFGISEDSLNKAYTEYNIKFKKLFDYYYNEGGEFEISKDDLKESYCDGKYSFQYITASLTTTDDDGNTVDITDVEKDTLTTSFESYKKKIETGYQTLEYSGQELQVELGLDSAPYTSVDATDFVEDIYPTEIMNAVKEMDDNTLQILEANGQLVLLQKNNIEDSFETAYSTASDRLSMMLDLKADEFNQYILEQAAADETDIEINDAAIKHYKVKSLITDSNKSGTSSTASESSSETSDDTTSEETSSED